MLFSEFIKQVQHYRHHALLLISKEFIDQFLSDDQFSQIVKEFSGVQISSFEDAKYHGDIFSAKREKKTLSLEDIEQLKESSLYPPLLSLRRLFFLEHCERMNASVANVLLKILEEPVNKSSFFLTTHDIRLVPATIVSRCQKIYLQADREKSLRNKKVFAEKTISFIRQQVDSFKEDSYFLSSSLSEKLCYKKISWQKMDSIIHECEKLTKEYSVDEIRGLLVFLTSERLKRDSSFLELSRFILANISDWKESENFHPTSQLWLIRFFLGFQLS